MVAKNYPPRNTKTIIRILHDHGVLDENPDLVDDLYLWANAEHFWRYQDGYDAGYTQAQYKRPHQYPLDD